MNKQLNKAAYTVNEFLTVYGIGRTRFYQEVGSGRLKIKKLGRRTLIARLDAELWFENLPEAV